MAAVVELDAEAMVAGGDALARAADGRIVFVTGALPGERVEAEVTEQRRDHLRATVLRVLSPSPDRTTPPCPHRLRGCGGCGWQHVRPEAQPALKVGVVVDALRRLGRVPQPDVVAGPPLPAQAYRTTVRVAVDGDGRAAYRARASHDLLTVDSCLVAHPLLAELVADGRFAGASEVTLRCGARTGERLALVTPSAAGVRLPDDVVVVGADELAAGRRAWFHEEVAGRQWRISARSFAQARPDGAEALIGAVAAALDGVGDGRLVDAYGGVGIFAGTVGRDRETTLIEWSSSAVADARHNLAGSPVRILRLDVDRWRPSAAAAVVCDPARTGLGRRGVAALAGAAAARLVLVSCDAAALGRDAALLARAGYRLDGTTVIDLFPHTPHLEAVSRFIRVAPGAEQL